MKDDLSRPWKLYALCEGLPRVLMDAYPTLGDAARAIAEIKGIKSGSLSMTVRLDVRWPRENRLPACFEYAGTRTRYVIELIE